jgi:beta-lactamase superfamily II metal-dependent hydrolase
MNLTVFQSDKGDCVLLTGADGKVLLADGGMPSSYKEHVAPALGAISAAGQAIDLVYVSHIDHDHIGGILCLLDDTVDWRVFDYQSASGNDLFGAPESPRPPKVHAIWHNAFQDQVEDNTGEIENLLVNNMRVFLIDEGLSGYAETYQDLISSKREALLLSNRVSPEQLNIPVNPESDGRLMLVTEGSEPVQLGGIRLHILGPFPKDLEKLRDEWNKWLSDNQEAIRKIREQSQEDAERLHWDEGEMLHNAMMALATELGRRNLVTPPNLASLMLLAEEEGKTVLLTGDGHADDIRAGLDHIGKLDSDGRIHVNVLKVQHHGSENNIHLDFCQTVTADHYVFCANGAHHNPDLDVLRTIIDSRLGADAAPAAFKLWFNSSVQATKPSYREHMRQVEELVKSKSAQSGGRMTVEFLETDSYFEIAV